MYILTHHYSLLAISASDGTLKQVASLLPEEGHKLINLEPEDVARLHAASSGPGARGVIISSGALAAYEYVEGHAAGSFSLFKEGFVSASPEEDKVTHDRKVAMTWETFHFVDPEEAFAHLQVPHQREEALEARAIALLEQKLPVCLHFGCAATRIKGFLNIDKYASFGDPKDYFLLDFAEKSWPIPDSSVDYIYSEDFIEHIQQQNQIAFLAEAFRVLKKGCYHRVSTPCLLDSMRTHSDFTKGFNGVYSGEFTNFGHICIFTRSLMSDIAYAIGYEQVYFTAKSCGSSPHAVPDRRPNGDRNDISGNIYADLLK